MPDLRRFGQTLDRILPFLANEKMQRENIRRWLESNLQELSAREASQGRIQDQMTANAIKKSLARSLSQYFETVPGGQYAMPGALKTTLPGFTSGIEELPNAPAELDAVTQNLVDIYNQFQTGEKISPEALRAVVGRVKGDIPLDVVKGSVTSSLERGRQALTERGYNLEERGLGIREKELAAREEEAKGGGAKDAAAVMKEAQNDREASILKYGGVGQIFGLAPDAKRALKSSIKNANRRIDAAAVSAGIESPIKAPQEMFKAGLAILSRYANKGELPSWYDLLFLGYDPDFVFGLQEVLEKPDKKAKAPAEDSLKRAQALLQAILEGKVD
jgi:hypothetical protein